MLTAEVVQPSAGTASLTLDDLRVTRPDGSPLLTARHVCCRPGVTALLGSNGSGKSTLLRTLAGSQPVGSGAILLDRVDAAQNRRAFLERLVFLPQNFSAYPDLTGCEFLVYALRLRGARSAQARSVALAWLESVGLRHAADTKTGAYSQGMRQRLGFAYAMQLDVTLYLLDEPFAGVDPESREAMTDLLFRLSTDRIVIVSTHHVEEMLAGGSAVLRIADGKLIAE